MVSHTRLFIRPGPLLALTWTVHPHLHGEERPDVRGLREVSVKTRARWSMVLGEGTLSVLDGVDDLV